MLYSLRLRQNAVFFPELEILRGFKESFRLKLSKKIFILRLAVVILIVLALSRPQSALTHSKIESEGIDIVLAIDTSTSMLAEDFRLSGRRQNRLEVVKSVVKDFIRDRSSDRIAIVAFAGRAYMVCPLTIDQSWLTQNIERIKIGMIEDGTAIGSGIAASLNRLKDTKAKSKVIILLTDGRNNAGDISPQAAAEAAKALNIKVYTIGAATTGLAPYPVKDFFGNTVYQSVRIDIDEEQLKDIALKTNARYFRATDTSSLRDIYKEIDRLEKTLIEERAYLEYKELFAYFLIPAIGLLLLEGISANTALRQIP